LRVAAFALVVVVVTASPVAADWFVAPFIGLKFAGDTNLVNLDQGAGDTKLMFGATAGFVGDGILGFEGDFGYSPRFFEAERTGLVARSYVLTLMGNIIVTLPRSVTGLSLRPFISGGGGLLRAAVNDVVGALDFSTNLFGINAGGGAVGALSNRTSVRFELRYFKNVTEGEDALGFGPTHLGFWRTNVGITVR
jgi:hypothetical protein